MDQSPDQKVRQAAANGGVAEAAEQACRLLVARGERVAIAETTTGGLIGAALLTCATLSRSACAGSAIVYSNAAKSVLLGRNLPVEGLSAVSGEASRLLAEAIRATMKVAWGLAETGIAGPQTGRRSTKAVGLGYVAVAGAVTQSLELSTGLDDRPHNQQAFAEAALRLLITVLNEAPVVD